MKKKFLTAMILGITLLSACGKKEADVTASVAESVTVAKSSVEAAADQDNAQDVSKTESEAGDAGNATGEEAQAAVSYDEYELKNEYFGARLKSREETEEDITIIFEFINITDETFFKMDEEIKPGATWEKVVMYPKTRWEDMVDTDSWIHYELFDPDGNQFFAGGLVFKIDADIQVSEMDLFDEQK